ncbi:MAG: tetraacyldisaccharide 4'-kinase [Candidatus Omnitrophota bacterium]
MAFEYLLLPFSFIYYFAICLRSFFYNSNIFRTYSIDAKVISVGNITWGGTGKTPTVLFLLRHFSGQGRKVAVLIRGYGKDEPEMFLRLMPGVPVVIGKDRVKTAREAVEKHQVDTILLDDGFQHRRLKRDLDIVCIDATNPFGNGCVIPAGSLREGLSGLKRADIFLITKVDFAQDEKVLQGLKEKLKRINSKAVIAESIHQARHFYKLSDGKTVDPGSLRNKNVILLSAIGSPVSFETTVLKLGIKFKKHFVFRDHHCYNKKDLKAIEDYCGRNKIDMVITTEKDAVKLSQYTKPDPRYTILSIQLEITDNEQEFYNRLSGIYGG